jgi:hypothetical protein
MPVLLWVITRFEWSLLNLPNQNHFAISAKVIIFIENELACQLESVKIFSLGILCVHAGNRIAVHIWKLPCCRGQSSKMISWCPACNHAHAHNGRSCRCMYLQVPGTWLLVPVTGEHTVILGLIWRQYKSEVVSSLWVLMCLRVGGASRLTVWVALPALLQDGQPTSAIPTKYTCKWEGM